MRISGRISWVFEPALQKCLKRAQSQTAFGSTKVVRTAIQNAASVAGLLITTEAMVAELPKKQSAGPAMPPGGGMGGMDF